jgi:hypothetical protein
MHGFNVAGFSEIPRHRSRTTWGSRKWNRRNQRKWPAVQPQGRQKPDTVDVHISCRSTLLPGSVLPRIGVHDTWLHKGAGCIHPSLLAASFVPKRITEAPRARFCVSWEFRIAGVNSSAETEVVEPHCSQALSAQLSPPCFCHYAFSGIPLSTGDAANPFSHCFLALGQLANRTARCCCILPIVIPSASHASHLNPG